VFIEGSVAIAAPVEHCWSHLADLGSHVEWMADAESIHFTSSDTTGVGTTFECVTKVGPLKTVDKMRVVDWVEGSVIAVQHTGLVVGTGRFALSRQDENRCTISWTEDLRFPWFLGGVVTAFAAKPVLRRIWMGNLRRFQGICEHTYRH
jgi:carbon monoxide dehydrogenase subunit G